MNTKSSITTIAAISLIMQLLMMALIQVTSYLPSDLSRQEDMANAMMGKIDTETDILKDTHKTCEGDNLTECIDDMSISTTQDSYSLSWTDRILNIPSYFAKVAKFAYLTVTVQKTMADEISFQSDFMTWVVKMILWAWQISVFIIFAAFIIERLK